MRFLLTGLAVDAGNPASLMLGCKHVLYLDESRIAGANECGQRRGVSVFLDFLGSEE